MVSADRLVDALWPDGAAPDGAARSVMTYVSRLRGALGNGHIVTSGPGYRLTCDRTSCDADEFEALVAEAEAALPDRALACYDQALALWRGPEAFGEFAGEWWALAESTRLAELRVVAREEHAAALMAIGHHGRAVPDLEALLVEHPLRERPVSLLMHAQVATGRQAEALRVFRAYRTRLAEQTGLEPSGDLVQLERTIVGSLEPASDASLGRPLRGYTIHEAIGEGSYGRVYLATQPGTERRIAIKVIRPDLADSSDFVRRFEAEARLVARLEHPHIVPLYDYWREPGGAYLVFRYLAGGTAREAVISGGPWSVERVSQLVEEVGGALVAAHAAGVLHNDVTSSNVMLDDRGSAYLTDFGIAVGNDQPAADADPRGDVRGLGWVLWELLAGKAPELGVTPSSVVRRRPRDRAPRLIESMAVVPEGLDAVLAKATDPDNGYASMAELVLGWRAAVGRPEGVLSPVGTDERRAVDSARRAAARQLAESAAAGINPYKGLRPFDEADASAFFGRDAVADDLEEVVRQRRLVTIVGASGSGKSSLVGAGLVPRLRAAGHTVVTMNPGDDPVGALHQALSEVAVRRTRARDLTVQIRNIVSATGPLAVVVDQFEECWSHTPADRRDEFLDVLARCVEDGPDVRFVTTIRADVLDRPLQDSRLGASISAGAFVLAPLTPAQLGDAIALPAARAGVTVDDAVVAELVTEAATQPGSLPLLQFTLAELYDRRVDGRIGPDALTAVGGMAGSIGRRAEEIFAALEPSAQEDTRDLFSRLVTPGEGAPDSRRRARLSELSGGAHAVADQYVAARLLFTDRDQISREPTIEVAHEALLSRWSRLADWVDGDRRWLTQLQHLATAAGAWDERGRASADLYRGARLESAIEALGEGRAVSDLERQFVDAGRDARDNELRAARRSARRLRRLLAGVGALLVVALVAGLVALDRGRAATRERAVARARELAAAANASLVDDPELSVHLALAAIDTARADASDALPEAETALHSALTSSRVVLTVPDLGGWLDWSSDGTTFVAEGPEDSGLIDLRDAETGASLRSWKGHDVDVNFVAFSPDSTSLATTGDDGALRLWDTNTGELIWEHVDDEHSLAWDTTFTADGTRVFASWPGGPVRTFDARTGDMLGESAPVEVLALSVSPDGRRVAAGGWGFRAVVDAETAEPLATLGDDGSRTIEWSPDGQRIAVGAFDGTVQLWSPDGELLTTAVGHLEEVLSIDWSADSSQLVTGGADGKVKLWAVTGDGLREELVLSNAATASGVVAVAFSPDGARVMASDTAITAVTIWDTSDTGAAEWINVPAERGNPFASAPLAFAPDGRVVVSSSGGVDAVAIESGRHTALLEARSGDVVEQVGISDDGQRLAISTGARGLEVIDIPTQRRVGGLSEPANELAWSADGEVLAASVALEGNAVVVLDRDGWELARYELPPDLWSPSIAISPDGRLIAMSRWRLSRADPAITDITVWDWRADEIVATIQRDETAATVAFDPTGTRVVASSYAGRDDVDVWDVTSGERLASLAASGGAGVAVSPDGATIATGHTDGLVRLWDAETGLQRLELPSRGGAVARVVFSPDGSRLASISADGLVRVWAVDLDDLVAIAEDRITRPLSDDECRQYLHLDRCPTD
jgi:WD40 repeat protein/DNA-binding SARP family transcriptional activator